MLLKNVKMNPNFAHVNEQYFNNFMGVVSSLGTGRPKLVSGHYLPMYFGLFYLHHCDDKIFRTMYTVLHTYRHI